MEKNAGVTFSSALTMASPASDDFSAVQAARLAAHYGLPPAHAALVKKDLEDLQEMPVAVQKKKLEEIEKAVANLVSAAQLRLPAAPRGCTRTAAPPAHRSRVPQKYILYERIGGGAFGNVYKGCVARRWARQWRRLTRRPPRSAPKDKPKNIVAVKIIDLEDTSDDVMTINRELAALSQARRAPASRSRAVSPPRLSAGRCRAASARS
jgi:hypothetical protein